MMNKMVPAIAVAALAVFGVSSAAQAAVHTIDFSVSISSTGGGTLGYTGATLDKSSAFDFDGTKLIVTSVGPDDDSSGLSPGDAIGLMPTLIMYGPSLSGPATLPGSGVVKSWTGAGGDLFTETLTAVDSINRTTKNAITVLLTGTVTDSLGLFTDTPASMLLSATQVGGPHSSISVSLTNFAATSTVPEPATWVMMGLGFAALGYAAVRRSSKDRSAVAMI